MDILETISENPDAISEFSREQLDEARAALLEAGRNYTAAIKDGTSEDKSADLASAKEAKELLESVDARLAEFAQADAEIDAEVADIEVAFEPADELVETDEPEATDEDVVEEVEEVVAEAEEIIEEAAKQPSIGQIAKNMPKQPEPDKEPALVASAGPGIRNRAVLETSRQLGEETHRLWKSFGSHAPKSQERHLVASFDTSKQYEHEVTGDLTHDAKIIDQLVKDAQRLDALTAAGLCGPGEPIYDFFSISAEAGMIQLPSVFASRGQLIYPVSPSYATIRDTSGWSAAAGQQYTNSDAEAENSKNVYSVQCPGTTTCTVDAYPVILQYGNFQDRFNPELVAHTQAESMRFHAHFVNASLIADMVTASTSRGGGDTGGGGLVNVANLVGFEAMAYRDNFRMSPEATLDLVVPAWTIDALVADLVARNATTSFENARARVRATFASLNLRVQEVQDWQSPADAGDGGFRTAADFMLFAPGTFVRMDGGSLNLGIVRDSTLNSTNEFQVFVETFEAVCEVGHDSWLLDDITICPRGSAAADVSLDCNPGFGS